MTGNHEERRVKRVDRRFFLRALAGGVVGWLAGMLPPGARGRESAATARGGATASAAGPGGGSARLAFANRVVHVYDPAATSWDFSSGFYYDFVDQAAVDSMLDRAMMTLTGDATPAAAWSQILSLYRSGDIVAVKINTNDVNWGENLILSVPELINSVVRGLKSAGVPEPSIHVFDSTRPGSGPMPQRYLDKTHALYPGVVFVGPDDSGFRGGYPDQFVSMPNISWDGRISDELCRAQHLISMPILKAIRVDWGNSGALKLHHGTIDTPQGTHVHLVNASASTNPVAAICSNPHVRDKLRLVVTDGLFGMWSGRHFAGSGETTDVPAPWQTFGGAAANSVFVAVDPLAVDCVQLDLINRERAARGRPLTTHPILDACAEAGLGIQEHSPALAYTTIDYRRIDVPLPVGKTSWGGMKSRYR
jgi:hypothetical protein